MLSGTNVIRFSRNDLQASHDRKSLAKEKLTNPEWHSAVVAVSKSEPGGATGKVGQVQYPGHRIRIPAGKEQDVIGRVMDGPKRTHYTVLVEKGCVPIWLLNLSERDIIVNPRTLLADAFLV